MTTENQSQLPDKRLEEIRARQEEIWTALSGGKEYKRSVAHAVIKTQHRDINHLLSLVQQPTIGERLSIPDSLTGPDVPCTCGTFNVGEPRALLDGHDHLHTTVYCSPTRFSPTTSERCGECGHQGWLNAEGVCQWI